MRSERFEALVAAPLEDVWWALTTGEGLAAWFGTHAKIDLRIDGRRVVGWGDGDVVIDGVVSDIDPMRRLRISYLADGREVGAEEWLLATESGSVRVTLINSMSDEGVDDWEGFYGDMRRGWRLFMASLSHALTTTADPTRQARCRYVPAPGERTVIWQALESVVDGLDPRLEPVLVDPPHARLLGGADRTLLVDAEGSGPHQVVYVQVAGHPTLDREWGETTLDAVESALAR